MAFGPYYNAGNKSVVDGDVIQADDINDINEAVEAAFELVAADLDDTALGGAALPLVDLTPSANQIAYYSGATTAALTSLTSQARSLLDDTTASAMRTTLELNNVPNVDCSNADNISSGTLNVNRVPSSIARVDSPTFTGTPAAPTASPGTSTTQLATTAFVSAATTGSVSNITSFKNAIINGGFDFWVDTSDTGSGYATCNRWYHAASGVTKTSSRGTHTVGQTDVPGNPKYFARMVTSSSDAVGDYLYSEQRIESVQRFSGENVTFTFYAKASGAGALSVEFTQDFGTGGSPSSDVNIAGGKFTLTTSWVKQSATIAIPSISGKTLGSNGDDFLAFRIWYTAGSTYDSRTDSLGHQNLTVDISNVQVESGSISTNFEIRSLAIEQLLCERYYEVVQVKNSIPSITGGATFKVPVYFKTSKRATPDINTSNTSSTNVTTTINEDISTNGLTVACTSTTTGAMDYESDYLVSAEL